MQRARSNRSSRDRTTGEAGAATVAVVVGSAVVLAAAVGGLLIARAAMGTRRRDGAEPGEPEDSLAPAVASARTAAVLLALRHLAYWGLSAVAAVASWLARAAKPSAD